MAEILNEAVNISVYDMSDILKERLNIDFSKITMLLSLVGHAQICQTVDPMKTARFTVPKWVLKKIWIQLI